MSSTRYIPLNSGNNFVSEEEKEGGRDEIGTTDFESQIAQENSHNPIVKSF